MATHYMEVDPNSGHALDCPAMEMFRSPTPGKVYLCTCGEQARRHAAQGKASRVGPNVPGEGPITGVILFGGNIFAARGGIVYRLTDEKWEQVCMELLK